MKFTFVSYNIRRQRNIYEAMINYVNLHQDTIVAIQERPTLEIMSDISKKMPAKVKHIYKTSKNDLAIIFPSKFNITLSKPPITNMNMASLEERTLQVNLPLLNENIEIINLHGFSKRKRTHESSNMWLFEKIKELNKASKHIVIGDFNINPYEEKFMYDENYFLSYRDIEAVKEQKSNTTIYYNPCWKYMSEQPFPKGTYYYDSCTIQWSMLDQVLITKTFVDSFKEFEIPRRLGNNFFSQKNCRNEDKYSDHLPIKLTMEV